MSFRLQSVSYGLDKEFEGMDVLTLICGLDVGEEPTVSELGVDGPLEMPDVVEESVGECFEPHWTEDDGHTVEALSSGGGGVAEQSEIKSNGCLSLLGWIAQESFSPSEVSKVSLITDGEFSTTSSTGVTNAASV